MGLYISMKLIPLRKQTQLKMIEKDGKVWNEILENMILRNFKATHNKFSYQNLTKNQSIVFDYESQEI